MNFYFIKFLFLLTPLIFCFFFLAIKNKITIYTPTVLLLWLFGPPAHLLLYWA